MEITCRVYKPRRPRESPLFRLVEQHLEELLRVWPARFARQHGPLRPVVERVLREFLKCDLLKHGFARLWCSECRRSVLVAPYWYWLVSKDRLVGFSFESKADRSVRYDGAAVAVETGRRAK